MNRLQDAQDGMGKLVYEYLMANDVTITASGVTKITNYTDHLGDTLAAIDSISPNTAQTTHGVTQTKKAAKEAAIQAACQVAGMVCSYAKDNNLTQLATSMTFTPAELRSKKDEDLRDYLRLILMDASDIETVTPPLTSPLIPYGIVPDGTGTPVVPGTLTVFEGLITTYSNLTTAPRSAITARKGFNEQLTTAFADMNDLLSNLDNLVEALRDKYPDFVMGYFNARMINGPLTRYTRIAGTITDPFGHSIANVTVRAAGINTDTNEAINYKGLCDDEGNYYIRTPKFRSVYTVKYSKPGYKDVVVAGIEVKLGKTTTENVVMQAGS